MADTTITRALALIVAQFFSDMTETIVRLFDCSFIYDLCPHCEYDLYYDLAMLVHFKHVIEKAGVKLRG